MRGEDGLLQGWVTAKMAFDVIILCSCTEILIVKYYWGVGVGEGGPGWRENRNYTVTS